MSDTAMDLAALEASLDAPGSLSCPVCRLAQPAANRACQRCGADLGLLSDVHAEAAAHRQALYQAAVAGDTIAAVEHLQALTELVGPSLELAVLRKLLRRGAVPVEVLSDALSADGSSAEADLLQVYAAELDEADDPLALPAPVEPIQAAFAALYADDAAPEPVVAQEPTENEAPDTEANPDGEPPSEPAIATSGLAGAEPPPAPEPRRARPADWLWPAAALLMAVLMGYLIGELGRREPAELAPRVETEVQDIGWRRMAPLPTTAPAPELPPVPPSAAPE
jgi:hypothetical protein